MIFEKTLRKTNLVIKIIVEKMTSASLIDNLLKS